MYLEDMNELKSHRNSTTAESWNPGKSYNDPIVERDRRVSEAVYSLYQERWFQCSVCGARFERHQRLVDHHNTHFVCNKTRYGLSNIGCLGLKTRKNFMSKKAFIYEYKTNSNIYNKQKVPLRSLKTEKIQGDYYLEDHVSCDDFEGDNNQCFVCEERFEVLRYDENQEDFYIGATKVKFNEKECYLVHTKNCIPFLQKQCLVNKNTKPQGRLCTTQYSSTNTSAPSKPSKSLSPTLLPKSPQSSSTSSSQDSSSELNSAAFLQALTKSQ
ncbi:unnamed protein product [Moneuplotes crassus]|uniref:C2H2-type domain-containing protein n=1 Tax=Euplotes crassus TaxID=5936 RepID=A0AAD1U2K8_EUPCR|nr:unnamed protein product [Moneuplotes crassus]